MFIQWCPYSIYIICNESFLRLKILRNLKSGGLYYCFMTKSLILKIFSKLGHPLLSFDAAWLCLSLWSLSKHHLVTPAQLHFFVLKFSQSDVNGLSRHTHTRWTIKGRTAILHHISEILFLVSFQIRQNLCLTTQSID